MKYFEGLTIESEIKARYKELAKTNHPDIGGCVEIMKIINSQYEKVITGAYQRQGKSISEIDDLLQKDAMLREKLNSIVYLDGIIIELCGSWLWVTGDTKTHKEKIKENGFKWSKTKISWYWRGEQSRSFNRKPISLNEIREKHGSYTINFKKNTMISKNY
jgi:hypothetical protein